MTLEELMESWRLDCDIDKSELGREALAIPKLHHKYLREFKIQGLKRARMEAEFKSLRHRKLDFYINGHNDESRRLGWEAPARGRVLKTEANGYLDSDPDVISAGLALAEQVELVDAIEQIVRAINNRNFIIKNAIEWERFTTGG